MCSPSLQSVQGLQVGVGGNDDSGRSRLFSLAGAESECGNLGSLQSQNRTLEKRGQHTRERVLLGAAGALSWIHPTQCRGVMMSGENSQEKYMDVKGEVSVSYSFHCCDLSPASPKKQLMGRKVCFISRFEGFHSAESGKV